MRKVSRRPTWAMFAISGLAVWLIDNWPPHKSICFLLIFIPAGDTSTVPSFPWTKGAKQKECDAGPWEPHFPNPRRPGEKPGLGLRNARTEGFLGSRVGGESAKWTSSPPRRGRRLCAAGLRQCSCSQSAVARTKGPWGAADRVSLAAWGRGGLAAGEEGLFRSFLIASSQRGLGGSQLSGRGRVPSPTQAQ